MIEVALTFYGLNTLPEIHVNQCGFAPVMCENEGCWAIVNKRDQENHEKNLCQFRITKFHDCTDIKEGQNEIKVQITQMEDQIKVRSNFRCPFFGVYGNL